jgi:glycosyltransferase involved in cell wall biosynthesis
MISVCILTKNAASTLEKTLQSTLLFSEVLLLDNGSTDASCDIAARFSNVKICTSPFLGFGPLRNKAAFLAKNDWILALDSDEILSLPLQEEIASLPLQKNCIYSVHRHNFYNGKHIRGCGWHPERIVRLYHREMTNYSDAKVHEAIVEKDLKKIQLRHPIYHTPYKSTSDFLLKMERYSTLFAEQYQKKKKASLAIALRHAIFAFFRSYFLRKGWSDGKEGFLISFYNANTCFYKYIKLKELNEKQ